jgi:hypothetical protein
MFDAPGRTRLRDEYTLRPGQLPGCSRELGLIDLFEGRHQLIIFA